jgi:POT family proton-dependent oligopeptide transporter
MPTPPPTARLKVALARLLLMSGALFFVYQGVEQARGQEGAAGQPAAGQPAAGQPAAAPPAAEPPAKEAVTDQPAKKPKRPEWREGGAEALINKIFPLLKSAQPGDATPYLDPKLTALTPPDALAARLKEGELLNAERLVITSGITQADGYRVDGEVRGANDAVITTFYAILKGPEGDPSALKIYDIQTSKSFMKRVFEGKGDTLDIFAFISLLALLGAFAQIIFNYIKGLTGSPRELYLLFITKVLEYSAYGAANLAFVLYLSKDLGLSDLSAGSYIGFWSMALTVLTMLVGAICDAIGIKATLLLGCYALLLSRGAMPFLSDITSVTLLGFVPLAFGIAVTGPVLSVGIKRYTNKAGAALGFGLFYTLMNVGWAIGAWIFDATRSWLGEGGSLNLLGAQLSTYEVIIGIGFLFTLPNLLLISLMRHNVERTEEGVVIHPRAEATGEGFVERFKGSFKKGSADTLKVISEVFTQRAFWIFIGLIGVTVFVRLTFYHFHYTFPKYGIRLFGEGVKIGSIFGVLNPLLIIFLVPLIASVTQNVRSYWMLLLGSVISTASVFLVVIDPQVFAPLADTWFAEVIFDWWLEVPTPDRIPFYLSLVTFIFVFTIGEAIWSPRLMQFTAEIAPKGKEGSYIALSALPGFLSKFIAGPMSGWLVATYTPEGATSHPEHYMVWVWIGGMAALTPIGLLAFSRAYRNAELRAAEAEEAEANARAKKQ